MSVDPSTGPSPLDDGFDDQDELEEVIVRYIERMNVGEMIHEEEICRDHPELTREILERLEIFQELGGFERPSPPLGTLGDYTLRRQIGRGGMGVVYEAWENSMDRQVALKVLPPGVAVDDRAFQRFMQEAKTAGKLNHQNIVPVHALGVYQGTPYFSMEYIEGETLAQLLARIKEVAPGTDTPFGKKDDTRYFANLAEAFADVADGLQHAHSKGVIHRDVKPSNLILDFEGGLRILDFGLARLEGQESLTLSGDVVGTPAYMSPEQARRKKVAVDHRTDVYSLGATLYEALAGRTPFSGKDHGDTLSQIIEKDPAPPRSANLRMPKDLETIVLKCLRKEASDRYGTAEALGQDLRRFVRGDPVEARPEAPLERLRRRLWRARSRVAVFSGALLLVLACGLLGVNYYLGELARIDQEYHDLVTRAVSSIPAAGPTLHLVQMGGSHQRRHLLDLLADETSVEAHASGQEESDALAYLEEAAELLPQRPAAHYHRARYLWYLGQEKQALEVLNRVIDLDPDFAPARLFRAAAYEHHGETQLAAAERDEARRLADLVWIEEWSRAQEAATRGDWNEAAQAYKRLIEQEDAGGEFFAGSWLEARLGHAAARLEAGDIVGAHRDCHEIHLRYPRELLPAFLVGHTYVLMKNCEDCKDWAREWFREFLEATAPPEVDVYKFLFALRRPNWETAILWLEAMPPTVARDRILVNYLAFSGRGVRAIEVGNRLLEDVPEDPLTLASMAVASTLVPGLSKDTEAFVQRAAKTGSGDADVCALLAVPYIFLGEYSEAEKWARRALDLRRDFTWAQSQLANVMKFQGRSDELIEWLKECLERAPRESNLHAELGAAYRFQRQFGEAMSSLQRALELEPTSSSLIHCELAGLYEVQGQMDQAEAHYRKAISIRPEFAESHGFLGRLLRKMGRFDEALGELCKSLAGCGNHTHVNARIAHRNLTELLRWKPKPSAASISAMDDLIAVLEAYTKDIETLPHVLESLALLYLYAPDRKDPSIAVEYARKALRMDRSARLLATLATAEAANERLSDAVRTMERSVSFPDHEQAHLDQLAEYREALLPEFASYASIDAALEGIAPYADDGGRITELLEAVTEPSLSAYYDGRLFEFEGKHAEASRHYDEAVQLDARASEPRIRLAGSLASSGRSAEADERLRLWITGDGRDVEVAWDAWITLSFKELGRSPSQVLARFPDTEDEESVPSLVDDFVWLLERLAQGESIRINCGADEDYTDPGGILWSRDRFFRGGSAKRRWPKRITGSRAEMLYVTERLFRENHLGVGYRMPLPSGRYRLTLHFAEVLRKGRGVRVFDVDVEGETVLRDFEPLEKGYGVAWLKEIEVDVADGRLDIEFRAREGKPKISAIEIERLEN